MCIEGKVYPGFEVEGCCVVCHVGAGVRQDDGVTPRFTAYGGPLSISTALSRERFCGRFREGCGVPCDCCGKTCVFDACTILMILR
jgi:hypothetical protein